MSVSKTAPVNAPWFEHLDDSVRALGEAADEWRLADQAACLLQSGAELERRLLHDGTIAVHRPDARGWHATPQGYSPHHHAVFDLQEIYREHRCLTRDRYQHAALLYASGAAWAIASVQAGQAPERVLFVSEDWQPIPRDYKITGLGNYTHADRIAAAYNEVLSMHLAAYAAKELAGRDHVTDHEAREMFEASKRAEGLADAAYAYGRLAEGALQCVLLGPKERHREQLPVSGWPIHANPDTDNVAEGSQAGGHLGAPDPQDQAEWETGGPV